MGDCVRSERLGIDWKQELGKEPVRITCFDLGNTPYRFQILMQNCYTVL
jgi:hypothetical protein